VLSGPTEVALAVGDQAAGRVLAILGMTMKAVEHGLFASRAQLEHRSFVESASPIRGAIEVPGLVHDHASGNVPLARPAGESIEYGESPCLCRMVHPVVVDGVGSGECQLLELELRILRGTEDTENQEQPSERRESKPVLLH